MKKLKVYLENGEIIDLLDDNKSDLLKYAEKISKLLEASTAQIIETSNSIMIVRPSKISAIKITQDKHLTTKKIKIKVNNRAKLNGNV